MKVGIHMTYQRCESTLIGLQTASWLRLEGHQCSVLSFGARSNEIHSEWDKEVKSDNKHSFGKWLKGLSHVVWFNDLSMHNIEMAKKAKVKTILIASWTDPLYRFEMYNNVDIVLCFSPSLAKKIQRATGAANIVYSPLALPLLSPASSICLRPNRPRVLLNLRGPRSRQLGSSIAPMLTRIFNQVPGEWTIWVRKSMVNKKSWIHKCLKTTHPDSSFKFETRADWDSQRLLYGWSDFTLLPVIHSDHGLVPLMSLSMGSPVATFDIPPSNEYINKGNGILAPCQVKYDKVGLASLVPDVQRFESMVKKTLTDGDLVVNMKDHTNDYANDRKSAFIKTWRNLLN